LHIHPAQWFSAIAQINRFACTAGRARWCDTASDMATRKTYFNFNGWVAARIPHTAALNECDF
jgi:hypothetical protein